MSGLDSRRLKEMRDLRRMLLDTAVADHYRQNPADKNFVFKDLATIYEAVLCTKNGTSSDPITIEEYLAKHGLLEVAGGRKTILDCCEIDLG